MGRLRTAQALLDRRRRRRPGSPVRRGASRAVHRVDPGGGPRSRGRVSGQRAERIAPQGAPTPVSVRQALAMALAAARRPLLVVSDFDGTLSQIVNDPWGARILPLGRTALRRLAGL